MNIYRSINFYRIQVAYFKMIVNRHLFYKNTSIVRQYKYNLCGSNDTHRVVILLLSGAWCNAIGRIANSF